MKQPKINDLKLNVEETKKIRSKLKKQNSVKITINIDTEILKNLRLIASETGVPYQRLINRLLKNSLDKKDKTTNRLDKLEKEIKELKQKLAA